jgi:serine protease Do
MSNRFQIASLALVAAAAVLFGMVLAGGMQVTPVTTAETTPPRVLPVAAPAETQLPVLSFADIAERVTPAVVGIQATEFSERDDRRDRPQSPFDFFFRDAPRDRFHRGPDRRDSGGSGFIISADGYILTNYHVVEDSDKVQVEVPDGGNGRVQRYEAEIVGEDPSTDLALIKIDAEGRLPYLELGNSDRLRVGDWVMAIGNPIVYDRTVTVGVVSAKGRVLPDLSADFSLDDYIQTDAAINFGNSGGPLVNIYGEVVGVNTAISVAGQGIGFAVPIDIAKGILNQLKEDGRVARGYLGIELGQLDPDMAEGLGLASADGALVNNVAPNLPADEAGIRPGDVIIAVDGEEITSTNQLVRVISAHRPGERVRITVLRRGEERTFTARLTDREENVLAARFQEPRRTPTQEVLGISVGELTSEIRRSLDLDRGLDGVVVTDVNRTSEAWEEGIREGDVITEVNQEPIGSVDEFRESVEAAGDRNVILLYVVNANTARFVSIRLQE